MSGKGLPAGKDTGYALLDQQGITTSQFQQQVTYQRAVEGELAKTLEAIDGVNAAVVHIAMPKDTVFTDDQGKPTASVLLDLGAGHQARPASRSRRSPTWSPRASRAWTRPTSPSPTPTARCSRPPGSGLTAAAGDARTQMEQDVGDAARRPTRSRSWTAIVGPNHAKVSVRADLNLDQSSSTAETYTYTNGTPPVSQSTHQRDLHRHRHRRRRRARADTIQRHGRLRRRQRRTTTRRPARRTTRSTRRRRRRRPRPARSSG